MSEEDKELLEKENKMKQFKVEIEQYLRSVSAQSPVGVCTLCGSIRSRQDVRKEACPYHLVQHLEGSLPSLKEMEHQWVAAKNKTELDELLKQYFPKYTQLAKQFFILVEGNTE